MMQQVSDPIRRLAGTILGRGGRSPETLAEMPVTPKEDPLYPKVKDAMSNLFAAVRFVRPEMIDPDFDEGATFHLSSSDLKSANVITRFLPASKTRGLKVMIDRDLGGGSGFWVALDVARWEDRPQVAYRRLNITAIETYRIPRKEVRFYRTPIDTGPDQKLLGLRNANPVLALEQLTGVVGNLRAEYVKREVERTDELLNLRQRGLVNAIRKRAMDLCRYAPAGREEEKGKDEFMLIGIFKDNKINSLGLVFSSPSKDRIKTLWTRKDILDGIPANWLHMDNTLQGTTHSLLIENRRSKDEAFLAEGEVSLERIHQGHRILLERLRVIQDQVTHNDDECCVGCLTGKRFMDFLGEREGTKPAFVFEESVLLATSIPLVV